MPPMILDPLQQKLDKILQARDLGWKQLIKKEDFIFPPRESDFHSGNDFARRESDRMSCRMLATLAKIPIGSIEAICR